MTTTEHPQSTCRILVPNGLSPKKCRGERRSGEGARAVSGWGKTPPHFCARAFLVKKKKTHKSYFECVGLLQTNKPDSELLSASKHHVTVCKSHNYSIYGLVPFSAGWFCLAWVFYSFLCIHNSLSRNFHIDKARGFFTL